MDVLIVLVIDIQKSIVISETELHSCTLIRAKLLSKYFRNLCSLDIHVNSSQCPYVLLTTNATAAPYHCCLIDPCQVQILWYIWVLNWFGTVICLWCSGLLSQPFVIGLLTVPYFPRHPSFLASVSRPGCSGLQNVWHCHVFCHFCFWIKCSPNSMDDSDSHHHAFDFSC